MASKAGDTSVFDSPATPKPAISFPANYVSLRQLQEQRQLKEQQAKVEEEKRFLQKQHEEEEEQKRAHFKQDEAAPVATDDKQQKQPPPLRNPKPRSNGRKGHRKGNTDANPKEGNQRILPNGERSTAAAEDASIHYIRERAIDGKMKSWAQKKAATKVSKSEGRSSNRGGRSEPKTVAGSEKGNTRVEAKPKSTSTERGKEFLAAGEVAEEFGDLSLRKENDFGAGAVIRDRGRPPTMGLRRGRGSRHGRWGRFRGGAGGRTEGASGGRGDGMVWVKKTTND